MSDVWYYADQNGDVVGPFRFQELKDTLATIPNATNLFVWRDGLTGWKRAADIPEIKAYVVLPPPLPVKELKLTWLRMTRIWSACLWRFWISLLGMGLGLYLIDLIPHGEVSEKPIQPIDRLIGGVLLSLLVSWALFSGVREAQQKHYSDFWIAVVPPNPELTWFRVARVSLTCLSNYWVSIGLLYLLFDLAKSLFFGAGNSVIGKLLFVFLAAFVSPMIVLRIALRKSYGDFRFVLIPPQPQVDDSQRNREWPKEKISNVVIASIFAALCAAAIIWVLSWDAMHH